MTGEPIRAAVISDTHGLLRPEVEKILQSCDVVIHAGDFDNQMVFHKLKIKQPLYAVRGNNDGLWAEQLPLIRQFKLGEFSFLLVHDQSDLPRDLGGAQIVIYGHSHMYSQKQENGCLWLNPGSCGYRRFTLPLSMAVLTLEGKDCRVDTVFLNEEDGKIEIQKNTGSLRISEGENKRRINEAEKKQENQEKSEKQEKPEKQEISEQPEARKRFRDRLTEHKRQKDQLFVIAKIMRLMKRGAQIEWVAENMRQEPSFVENVYRICVTHPGVDAHQVLNKLEVNQLFN